MTDKKQDHFQTLSAETDTTAPMNPLIHKEFDTEKSNLKTEEEDNHHFSGIPGLLNETTSLHKSKFIPSRFRGCFAPDTLLSAVVTCISGSMGTVMLNLPKAYAIYGILFASIVQTIVGLNTAIASVFLAKLSSKYGNANQYSELVECVLEKKAKAVFNFFFMITVLGVMIGMNLTANSFLMNLIEGPLEYSMGIVDKVHFHSYGSLISSIIVVTLMIPFQLKNDTKGQKNISVFSIFTLFFVMMIIIIQAPSYAIQNNTQKDVRYFNFDSPMLQLQNLGIFIFSYNITTTYHIVKSSMQDPSENRLQKMGLYTVITLYLPYISIGVLGYISLGALGTSIDLFPNRLPLNESNDVLMKIGKVGLVITIYVAYLMRIIVIKRQFFDFFNMELTKKRNYTFVLTFLQIPALIGWSYPKVTDWFSLIGAFSMTALIITIPSMMMVKEYYEERKMKKLGLVLLWGVPMTCLGLAATVSVLLKMIGV